MAWRWEERHCRWAQAQRNDAASQARWETLALTLAVFAWKDILLPAGGEWNLLGDALGVLQATTKFRSKDSAVNLLCMELALVSVDSGRELHAEHLWSERNKLADDLSRLHEGASLPTLLKDVPQRYLVEPQWKIISSVT